MMKYDWILFIVAYALAVADTATATCRPNNHISSTGLNKECQHHSILPSSSLAKWLAYRSGGDEDGGATGSSSAHLVAGSFEQIASVSDNSEEDADSNNHTNEASINVNKDEIDISSKQTYSSSPPHLRFNSWKDERSILGRAVLTTPHRRMLAIRIAPGPLPSFSSPNNPAPIMTATPIFVTKFSLSESLGCSLRDLRIIDQFSPSGRYAGPAFLARKNCVIVNVGHVRAIVLRDQVYIFMPEMPSPSRSNGREAKGEVSFKSERINMGEDVNDEKKMQQKTERIESLVEALVTYLNSIYHSSHIPSSRDSEFAKSGISGDQQLSWYRSSFTGGKAKNQKKHVKHQQRRDKEYGASGLENESGVPPFELVVIEALLGHVCSYESMKAAQSIKTANDVLKGISSAFQGVDQKKNAFLEMQSKMAQLLPLKNKVDELEAKCSDVAGAIADVLKNDEDMAAMRLSELDDGPVPDGDPNNLHVEVELLFEDYLLQMDEVLHSLRSVQSSVRNTEEVVEIELDLLRNRIMTYEMLLELSGLVVGVAAAITGAFGMNLVNHYEEHPNMFYNVCLGLMVMMIGIACGFLKKLSMDNIM